MTDEAGPISKIWHIHQRLALKDVQGFPLLGEMLSWWRTQCQSRRGLFGRKAIDPLGLPRLALPHLCLAEFVNTPEFRVRGVLAGEEVRSFYGRSPKGVFVDQLYSPGDYDLVLRDILDMINSKSPIAVYRQFLSGQNKPASFRLLMLPLATDGAKVDGMLSVLDWRANPS